jgi:hypothetical protein
MKRMNLHTQHAEELVKLYERAAAEHGQATESGDSKATNKAHAVATGVYCELRRRGAQRLLLPLLKSTEPWVRHWAAAHALEFAPEEGAPVLEDLVTRRRFLGFDSKMVLQQWREGKLIFP